MAADAPQAPTPGQAAYEAHSAMMVPRPWRWHQLDDTLRAAWEAAATAVAGPLRKQLADAHERLAVQHEAMTQARADHREAMDALAALRNYPGPAVPQAAAGYSLRGRVIAIAAQLRKDADGIDADPHLSPLTRHADAEARRTAAARLDIAVAEDRAAAPRPVADAIRGDLAALRRHAGSTGPSRSARVRAAVAESERLILGALEATDG